MLIFVPIRRLIRRVTSIFWWYIWSKFILCWTMCFTEICSWLTEIFILFYFNYCVILIRDILLFSYCLTILYSFLFILNHFQFTKLRFMLLIKSITHFFLKLHLLSKCNSFLFSNLFNIKFSNYIFKLLFFIYIALFITRDFLQRNNTWWT